MGDSSEITSGSSISDVMSHREFQPLHTSPIKLNGGNYLMWSRSCLFAVGSRGLTGFLTGLSTKPMEEGTAKDRWMTSNYLVMSYLINSMDQEIAGRYLLLDSAAKIWSTAQATYSQVGNAAQCYDLRRQIHTTTQMELSLAQYYNRLCTLWQQLDFLGSFNATCTVDATAFRKWEDSLQVFDFLAGLNTEYDAIRATVLNRDPFPTLDQAYALVSAEESRRSAMIPPISHERSALTSNHMKINSFRGSSRPSNDKPPPKCDHCGKEWHTKEKCWKLHGRPGDTRGRGKGGKHNNIQAHQATSENLQTDGSLSQDELIHIRNLLGRLDTTSSSSLAASAVSIPPESSTSISGIPFNGNCTLESSHPWVIDSGATDHMTGLGDRQDDWGW